MKALSRQLLLRLFQGHSQRVPSLSSCTNLHLHKLVPFRGGSWPSGTYCPKEGSTISLQQLQMLSHHVLSVHPLRFAYTTFLTGLQFPFLFASSPCGCEGELREVALPQTEWNAIANFSPPKKLDHLSCIQPHSSSQGTGRMQIDPTPHF